jgi:hypothetical protein
MTAYERERPIGYQRPSADPDPKPKSAAPSHPRASQRRLIDLLREASGVHEKLSGFYSRMTDRVRRPKARLLLEYLSEHERYIQTCIREFEQNSDNAALQAWFKYTPTIAVEDWMDDVSIHPDMSEEEIATIVAQMDDALLRAFEEVSERAVPENVREAVENYLEMEKREKIRALRATALD